MRASVLAEAPSPIPKPPPARTLAMQTCATQTHSHSHNGGCCHPSPAPPPNTTQTATATTTATCNQLECCPCDHEAHPGSAAEPEDASDSDSSSPPATEQESVASNDAPADSDTPSANDSPSSPGPPPAADQTVVAKVRAIQRRTDLTQEEKVKKIQAVMMAKVRKAQATRLSTAPAAEKGVFPGAGAPEGCQHYTRKCWIKAACCNKYYPCRLCHDEAEDHQIDRRATQFIACTSCGEMEHPIAPNCRKCGARFAKYFCKPCRLYNDDPNKHAYHCEKCGICRVGKGLGIDNYHCDKCNTCVPIDRKDSHPCREHNLDANCPICNVHMGTSTEPSYVLRCSHPIHVKCLEGYLKSGRYTCPICCKAIPPPETMKRWYEQLDRTIAKERIPDALARRRSEVFCNDCETKSVAMWHPRYHKCIDCKGYNTRVLSQFDLPQNQDNNDTNANTNNLELLDEIDQAIAEPS